LSAAGELNIHELADRAGLAYSTAHREVQKLLAAGILAERQSGQARVIRPDDESPFFVPLRELLLTAFGPVPLLRAGLSDVPGVLAVAIFGSFAARTLGEPGAVPQDIDVLILGEPDATAVLDVCEQVSREVERPVNPTIFSVVEWHAGSGFAEAVSAGRLLPVLGQVPLVGAGA
jgi:hypothetical protein